MKASPSQLPPGPPPAELSPPNVESPPAAVESPGAGPATPPPATQAVWPEWFRPADVAVGILLVVAAFLAGSFAARNSDFFRHVATGRLLLQGKYSLGGDPFSFTASERPWVNPNWLFEVAFSALYSADGTGAVAVAVKAMIFAAAVGLLLLLRKPDQSLWPWVVLMAIAIMALAPQAALRPALFGFLFQVLTLLAIYRQDWTQSRWRAPAYLGVLSLVWANTDAFAFLAPLTALLVLVGELLQRKLFDGPDPAKADDAFFRAPPVNALGRGVFLASLALLLNPTFLLGVAKDPGEALAQLVPFELSMSPGIVERDVGPGALQIHSLSPLHDAYMNSPDRGYNLGGAAALVLVVLTAAALAVSYVRLQASQVVLWVAFIALALKHYRFLPYLVLVVVPITAAHLNALSARFVLGKSDDQRTKLILTLSGVARILLIFGSIIMVAAAVPGYLHPPVGNPAYARRVAWFVDTDLGMARGAEQLQKWRVEGQLPPEAHGLLQHFDFADYCAWFAPDERVFMNSRLRFHRRELVDLVSFRADLYSLGQAELTQSARPISLLLDKYKAQYVCLGLPYSRLQGNSLSRLILELTVNDDFVPFWFLNGRTAILGRIDTTESRELTRNLRFNVAAATFGPNVAAIPDGKVTDPVPPIDGWLMAYLDRPQPGSNEADDSLFLGIYSEVLRNTLDQRWSQNFVRSLAHGMVGGSVIALQTNPGPRNPTEDELALPIAAARAARRAIAESPAHPDGYWALAMAYENRLMPETQPGDLATQALTATTRFLARVPSGERVAAADRLARNYAPEVLRTAFRSAVMNLRPRTSMSMPGSALDYAHQHLAQTLPYLAICGDQELPAPQVVFEVRARFVNFGKPPETPLPSSDQDLRELDAMMTDPSKLASLRAIVQRLIAQIGDERIRRKNLVLNQTARAPVAAKFQTLLAAGLPGEACSLAKEALANESLSEREFGVSPFVLYSSLIDLELRHGYLETAAGELKELDEKTQKALEKRPDDPLLQSMRFSVKQHEQLKAKLEGNFTLAIALHEELLGKQIPRLGQADLDQILTLATSQPDALGALLGTPAQWYQVSQKTEPVAMALMGEGFYHYEMGLLLLQAGKSAQAREAFGKALKPQGVELQRFTAPQVSTVAILATAYQQIIQKYNAPSR